MSGAIRAFGTAIRLTDALTLAASVTLTQGATTKILTLSTSLPKASSGAWEGLTFAARVSALLRADLRAKAIAAGCGAPALGSVRLKIEVPTLTAVRGANKLTLTLDPLGFTFGGVQMVLTSASLNNSSGWASRLGLCAERTTPAPLTIAGGLGSLAGVCQPRWLWVFPNSTSDTWDNEVYPDESTIPLSDGSVRTYTRGVPEGRRDVRLVDGSEVFCGYPLDVRSFSSFAVDRSIVNLLTADEDGITGASSLYSNGGIAVGDPVRVGPSLWWSRVEAVGTSTLDLFDKAPSALSASSGMRVQLLSEAHAMMLEAKRTSYIFVYEPDDTTGQTRFLASPYALRDNGEVVRAFDRRDPFLSLYSVTLSLLRRHTPELES